MDVVIAGAGPNGLMLACELSLAGVRPVVLERSAEITPEPRANGLVGQVVRMLDRRGLYQRITGTGQPPAPAPSWMFAAMPLDLTGLAGNPVYVLPVPQARLTQILAERAAELGVEVRRGHELADLSQDGETVTATIDGPDGRYQLRTRYLVGADGGHSVTRKRLGIGFPGVNRDNSVSRSVNARPPAEWIDPASGALNVPGYGMIAPLRHHRTETGMFVWAPFPGRPPMLHTTETGVPGDTGLDQDKPLTLAEMEESIQRVLGVRVPLTPAGGGPQLMRRLIGTNTRLAERYRDRRVLLAGDAAHVHSATGGPGLNLGLQDTINLGWKLGAVAAGRAPERLLDTYETERRPVGERVIMQTQAQAALTAPGPDVTALRELFAELLADPANVRHIAATLAGSDVRYESGGHPLVGRFAPDLELRIDGGPVRLAELTWDGQPLLVDLTGAGLSVDGPWRYVRAGLAGGAAPDGVTALLLRPDTYVAWATSAAEPDADELAGLRAAGERWFG
ncbi:MAG: FAD-dependent monooxygenase [Actinobacteria bacterium]|nr:FAD-dependent monooxygenase [Actinomycetota bacterium]